MSNSDHLANERTLLAWIRTGIALIGFGFVIAKFVLFLHLLKPTGNTQSTSIIYGEVMIILGVITILYGLYTYLAYEKDLEKGSIKPKKTENTIFSVIIIIFAIILSFLLLF
ncbi:protein of unknown function DUF202 [Sulfolobus islandicus Y.G.57.14]|jgi:putative membrane protein|uniref:DUF202 domain-containing protein n=10 Tax=Saccharolobus islandicus TaxID=43080 RepID=C3MPM5_SACI2|nr:MULTISPECIES: DUF202 domain-containing protein [Sulfolobaceae]ACP35338.1 protein of unknown function DUF202 [Sulfolobus islandicus L.S.2.15]ACP37998.1 protein of unknown function DUF202 [Sulfolobus islandicus M.14.25]ACP45494.1 protein of unknown function DUF202 [Sulfolobus islandicus Y.G.57.14]ACP48708.1 protein of unknown function DUF202 [Sulfolobus islandicus Y.N.15.51]ACP55176.1 protein of unknown function DUF202 [Sulfolobus islandicus M.16.27]